MYQNRLVALATISGLPVVQQRREVAAWLTLDISSIPTHNVKPWTVVRIFRTPSVHNHREDPAGPGGEHAIRRCRGIRGC